MGSGCVRGGQCHGKSAAEFCFEGHLSLERVNIVEIFHVLPCFSIKLTHESLSICSLSDGHCCASELPYGVLTLLMAPASFLMTLPSSVLFSSLLVLSPHSRLLETPHLKMTDPSQRPPPLVSRVRL